MRATDSRYVPEIRRDRRRAAGFLAPAIVAGLLAAGGCASRAVYATAPADVPRARSLSEVLGRFVWPLPFDDRRNVSSRYGYRSWGGGYGRYHYGLDLHGRRGDPVYSAGDGVVAGVGTRGAYGNSVRVDHGHEVSTFYAHLDRVLTAPGRAVRRGEVIGVVGSTGNATGPHLHFELRWRDRWIDPLVVLPELDR
jgi:murein DD-endopeptidase MepM/ murein hydrolase activator NlpD